MAVLSRDAPSSSPLLAALQENDLLQIMSIAVPAILAVPAAAWAGYKLGEEGVKWWERRRQRLAASAAAADLEAIPGQAATRHLENLRAAATAPHNAHANVLNDEGAANVAGAYEALDENTQVNHYEAGPVAEVLARNATRHSDCVLDEAVDGLVGLPAYAEVIQQQANLNADQDGSADRAIRVINAAWAEVFVVDEDEAYVSDNANADSLEITPVNDDSGNERIDVAGMFPGGM